ncbi:MAG: PhzF family phenazine biosynthesis protein [Calditrichaceae bacterium]|nr:PhzF family phenazine biosynthesis protein [Calditrichaceae bacterium]
MYQIDAFTDKVFTGNPAAVCPLDEWLDDEMMQHIAQENNLAETAFFVRNKDEYQIRWFTPTKEVDLCGHATLASAYVIFKHLDKTIDTIKFTSTSGPLYVNQENGKIALDFPSIPPVDCKMPAYLTQALGSEPDNIMSCNNYLAVFASEKQIADISPDFSLLCKLDLQGVIITAPGKNEDFVSRYFAPKYGIPEDPVTGSAHCTLIPYWAERLNKTHLTAKQISRRSGKLFCTDLGDRVKIAGYAVEYLSGNIEV